MPGLAQREVERGRLVGPRAVAPRDLALRRLREEVEPGEVLGEARERQLARQRQQAVPRPPSLVVDGA